MSRLSVADRVHARAGTTDAAPSGVATLELIRREYRNRRILVGEAARAADQLLSSGDRDTRLSAISLLLELGQIDPLEPSVRRGVERVLAQGELEDEPLDDPMPVGDRLLFARAMLAARRTDTAERELALVLGIDPDNPVARTLLVRAKQAKGKLSDAIRIWESWSESSERTSALVELGMLYQASQQPERGSSQRIGHDATPASRNAAHLGLERAFRFASAGEFGVATELCDRVMAQHRTADRALFKLAAIEKAWLMEAAGRIDEAVAMLEALGHDADLVDDADRLVSLARLYEGRPDGLRKAIAAYEVLFESSSELVYLSRLAKLHARAGDRATAESYRRRHLAVFEQEVGEIRLDQLLRAASRRHVPLGDLERLSFASAELAAEGERLRPFDTAGAARKRALVAILRRDPSAARDVFAELRRRGRANAADLAYLAELEAVGGNLEVASACYWGSVRQAEAAGETTDPLALAGLLVTSPTGALPPSVRAIVDDSYRRSRACQALAELAKQRPFEPLAWRALATMMRYSGRLADAARHDRRADFLEQEAAARLAMPGHALTAAVYHARGERRGIVHELWATRYRTSGPDAGRLADGHVFANLADDLQTYLRSMFEATKTYARTRFGHLVRDLDEYAYEFKLTNEDEPSSGPSAGLAIAIAFLSVFVDKAVPDDMALSGVVVSEARDHMSVRRVGDADIKVHGALARRLRRIVLPAETRREVEESDFVPRDASRSVAVYVRSFDEALEAVFGEDVWLW